MLGPLVVSGAINCHTQLSGCRVVPLVYILMTGYYRIESYARIVQLIIIRHTSSLVAARPMLKAPPPAFAEAARQRRRRGTHQVGRRGSREGEETAGRTAGV